MLHMLSDNRREQSFLYFIFLHGNVGRGSVLMAGSAPGKRESAALYRCVNLGNVTDCPPMRVSLFYTV